MRTATITLRALQFGRFMYVEEINEIYDGYLSQSKSYCLLALPNKKSLVHFIPRAPWQSSYLLVANCYKFV
jgi:hypothetical protein